MTEIKSRQTRSKVQEPRLLSFNIVHDLRGNLVPIQSHSDVPFEIRRIYTIYEVPSGVERGGHAHKELTQLIMAVAGSFSVRLDDGTKKSTFHLSSPTEGLLLPRLIWREMFAFSPGAVCLVLASELYAAEDYVRDYGEFQELVKKHNSVS